MTRETAIALMQYDALIRETHHDLADTCLAWDSDTLVYGDGGCALDELCRPGFVLTEAEIKSRLS